MTDEELAGYRAMVATFEYNDVTTDDLLAVMPQLLDEIEQLRTANHRQSLYVDDLLSEQSENKFALRRLERENVALREIVQAATTTALSDDGYCFLCEHSVGGAREHAPDCLVVRARTVLRSMAEPAAGDRTADDSR